MNDENCYACEKSLRIKIKFGRWSVVGSPIKKGKFRFWQCICQCGKMRFVNENNLKRGKTISCGCYKDEKTIARSTRHGFAPAGKQSPEYQCFHNMHYRCSNENCDHYKNYGGRGIKVCDRWSKFENFIADMGVKPSRSHTIERIDNNGDYEPSNCRWATRTEQARNKRNNLIINCFGRNVTLAEASEMSGINYGTILSRIESGRVGDHIYSKLMHEKPKKK